MSEALRTWLEEQILQLQEALDSLDKLEATETELLQAGEAYAKLLEEKEASTVRIRTLEEEVASLKAPPVKPTEPPPPPAKPPQAAQKVTFTVKNGLDQPRVNEYVSVSVPLPQAWGVKSIDSLAVQGFPSGTGGPGLLLPADIRPIAWWPDRSLQSVIVEFRANIPAKAEGRYELLVEVAATEVPRPAPALSVNSLGAPVAVIVVDNGSTQFKVDPYGFYDSMGVISLAAKTAQGATTTFEGKSTEQHSKCRRFEIEYAGPLVAVVYAEVLTGQTFGPPPYNNVVVCRRYTFHAKSSLVQCREWIKWEGSWNGGAPRYMKDSGRKDGEGKPVFTDEPNAILGALWRERFTLSEPPSEIDILFSPGKSASFKPVPSLRIEQRLRPNRLFRNPETLEAAPREGVLVVDGSEDEGSLESGVVSVSSPRGTFTTCIANMRRMEPCAIGVSGSTVNLDLASDYFYLAHHQGAWQEYGVDVRGANQPGPDLVSIWAQLNHPLRGLCGVEHYNTARVHSPLPDDSRRTALDRAADKVVSGGDGVPPKSIYGRFDDSLSQVCDNTLAKIEQEGLWGLMTRGLFPRDWGRWGVGTGELGYNPNAVPGYPKGFPVGVSGWAEAYLHATWTDYWNVCRLAWDGAVRLSRPELLESLLVPAALRMLHTQIVQGAPEDPWTYIGGAPYGYGMYRSDGNSSHQYWETLYQYYYLTGDRTVPQTIERAARYETTRLLTDPKQSLSGRQPNQWIAAARFLSHVSTSGFDWHQRFLDLMRAAILRHYLPINADLAVWTERPIKAGEPNRTQQLFTWGHYDAELLWWFMQATGDAPVHTPGDISPQFTESVKPSEILIATARAVSTLGMTLKGNMKGSAAGPWVRLFDIAADGKTLSPGTESVDFLWEDDIPAMAAWISRAALLSNDAHLKKVSRALVEYSLTRALGTGWPMNKITGLQQARLGAAVAAELEIEAKGKKP